MFIERPPWLYRLLFPSALWRIPSTHKGRKVVYLTFDDGPIPEVTPWLLDLLAQKGIKASFFCVGDNVRKYPFLFERIRSEGHLVGNHTYHHLQGLWSGTRRYLKDVKEADELIHSPYFRPPHGHMRFPQSYLLSKRYKIVMWDLVTRDYSHRLGGQEVLENVKKYARNGSIIVFHDSLKSKSKLEYALPRAIDYLASEGYEFALLP